MLFYKASHVYKTPKKTKNNTETLRTIIIDIYLNKKKIPSIISKTLRSLDSILMAL